MSSKEKSEVEEVPNSPASEIVESKSLEESLDASRVDISEIEESREELATAGKLSDLALTNLLNNAIHCLRSDVKIQRRSAAFRELSKAVKVMEDFNCSQSEDSTSSEAVIERVGKKTEMLKILAAMSERSMIDAAAVAAKYTMQYDLALRERNGLISNIEIGKEIGKKGENQTKVQFAPGLKDNDENRDSECESKTSVKLENINSSETGSNASGLEKLPDSSDEAVPVSGSSEGAVPVSASSDAADPVSGSSQGEGELLTSTSGIGEQSSEVSEIEPSSEASEIEPSVTSETGDQLGPSEFDRQTSATTQTSDYSDCAAMPVLSSGQESSAVESDVLESCSELSRAEPAGEPAAVLSVKQEYSRTPTVSSSTKKKQTDLEGFIFLHLSIEYIALIEKERNNDIDAILAALFKVEDDLKKNIDKKVLKAFKVLFDDIGDGVLKFKNVKNVRSASSYFSESTFSEFFLPSHAWSLAGTSASSIQTDSPPPETLPEESGSCLEHQSSGESSARLSRQSSTSESLGPAQDMSRSRSESLEGSHRPPGKRVRANSPNSPNEGYPFTDGEKSFEFQGTPLSLDVKSGQEISVPKEEGATEVEKSKSDVQEEKSSGYHEDSSKKS